MAENEAPATPATLEEALNLLESARKDNEAMAAELEKTQKALADETTAKEEALKASSDAPTAEAKGTGMTLALFGRWLAQRQTMTGVLGRGNGINIARTLVEAPAKALGVKLPSESEVEEAFEKIRLKLPDVNNSKAAE